MHLWRTCSQRIFQVFYIVTTDGDCEDMIDHDSYAHNLSSCEIKARKKKQIQARTGFEPMTSAIPVQYVLCQLSYQAI